MPFAKTHFDTEGPLGLPMKDSQARLLEDLLRTLPVEERALRRLVSVKAPTELLDGERADVSWITTEAIDRDAEIVVAQGMNDAHFRLNPLVTLNHDYARPPVGRSLWRKRSKDGPLVGIKAKTQYPPRPADWTGDWEPDAVFQLIKAGLLQGKSIGFLCLKSHAPSSHEVAARPELAGVSRIIDEWLLLEYACTFLPCNQHALVEAVSKSLVSAATLRQLGVDVPAAPRVTFTPLAEIEKALARTLTAIDTEGLVHACWQRLRGRV